MILSVMGRFVIKSHGRRQAGESAGGEVSVSEALLTGVNLCLSLACSNRTVFVGEQNLFELTHFGSQRCHLILQTHGKGHELRCGFRLWPAARRWLTCSCRFVCVSSSAFLSSDDTQSFLFCLQRVAAARLRSRNFCLRSSGSCSTILLRRPAPPAAALLQLPLACTACWEFPE